MRKKDLWRMPYESRKRLDALKSDLCHQIKKAAWRRKLNRRDLASRLLTTVSVVSAIDNHRIERLTLNQLFRYLANIEPGFGLLISV